MAGVLSASWRFGCFIALSAAAVGCKNDPAGNTGSDGAAGTGSAALDGDTADTPPPVCSPGSGLQAPSCNDLVATGPCVGQLQVDDSAPAPGGGALIEGTYDLTDRAVYTNPGGASGPIGDPMQEALVLSGSGGSWTMNTAMVSPPGMARRTRAVTVSGSQLTLVETCPPSQDAGAGVGPEARYFTSNDQTLTLFELSLGGPVTADTYTRR